MIPSPAIAAILDVFLNILQRRKQQHVSQIPQIQPLMKTIRKKNINCDFELRLNKALKWRPWTPS